MASRTDGRKDSRSGMHTLCVPDCISGRDVTIEVVDPGADQFAARLRKVTRERRKWARKNSVCAFRLYDADLPDFAVAIDCYIGAGQTAGHLFIVVAEYQAPKNVDEQKAADRFSDAIAVTKALFNLDDRHIFARQRRREKGGGQYRVESGEPIIAYTSECGYLIELDFGSYLDTGLFLDHRDTRMLVGKLAAGKRFLNLFAYTGVATLHAAGGEASTTMTVDMSRAYLDRARRNMRNNGFSGSSHRYVCADVLSWVVKAQSFDFRYDLAFVDPPTFSNSKSMGDRTWDVQRDHVELLGNVGKLMAPDGLIVFSCNLRTFKIDEEALRAKGFEIQDITEQTIPHDFERNARIHQCFLIRVSPGAR